jgi:hypothetical protein
MTPMNDDPLDRRREEIRRALAEAVSSEKFARLLRSLPSAAQARLRREFGDAAINKILTAEESLEVKDESF